jgi:hypothetical protein
MATLLALAPVAVPTESFIRANYVEEDPHGPETGYARLPGNRFRQAWLAEHSNLSPFAPVYYHSVAGRRVHVDDRGVRVAYAPSRALVGAVEEVVGCFPSLSPYREELFATERVRLNSGEDLIAFYLYRPPTPTERPVYLSSVTLMDGGRCWWLPYVPEEIDPDHGGRARELWDVFVFSGTRFLLMSVHEYEARGFELFRVENGRLKRVGEFWYAFVGGG